MDKSTVITLIICGTVVLSALIASITDVINHIVDSKKEEREEKG